MRSRGMLSSYTRSLKSKGPLGITRLFKEFKIGECVVISIKPGHPVAPHPRYRGKHGAVVEKRGKCYVVEIKDGSLKKRIISSPVHLERVKR